MKKYILLLAMMSSLLTAEVKQVEASADFIKTGTKIIDIRTPSEWEQTGIVEGSHTLMFFNEQGGYDADAFIVGLNKIVKKDEQFALICRTGSRTSMISSFLDKELGYKVINLKGGIMQMMRAGYQPMAYKK